MVREASEVRGLKATVREASELLLSERETVLCSGQQRAVCCIVYSGGSRDWDNMQDFTKGILDYEGSFVFLLSELFFL